MLMAEIPVMGVLLQFPMRSGVAYYGGEVRGGRK